MRRIVGRETMELSANLAISCVLFVPPFYGQSLKSRLHQIPYFLLNGRRTRQTRLDDTSFTISPGNLFHHPSE